MAVKLKIKNMKKLFVIPFLALGLTFVACNNSSTSNNTDSQATTEETTEEATATETVPGIENVTLSNTWTVEGNDQMKFNTDLIRVKAGEPVELTLKRSEERRVGKECRSEWS